ncbi:hypothetical protein GLZ85_RS22130, partial [Escherichia coli]
IGINERSQNKTTIAIQHIFILPPSNIKMKTVVTGSNIARTKTIRLLFLPILNTIPASNTKKKNATGTVHVMTGL